MEETLHFSSNVFIPIIQNETTAPIRGKFRIFWSGSVWCLPSGEQTLDYKPNIDNRNDGMDACVFNFKYGCFGYLAVKFQPALPISSGFKHF